MINGGEDVAINWDRYTGANTNKKGENSFSSQTADSGTGRPLYTEDQITKAEKFITKENK